jgi:HK97 family phage prohead protease
MQIKTVTTRIKAGPADGLEEGQFLVYPSTFTREPDAYGDVVAKGAFADTIAEWKASGNVLPGLYGHRMDDPDYFVASALDMGEDDHGWWVKGQFDLESPKGPQVYRLAKGRRLNQLSFAFDTIESGNIELEDGREAWELRKLKVYEFSFVPVGANQDTSIVAIKALADGLKSGRVLSSKNESVLRGARDAIDSVLLSLGDDDSGKASPASGHPQANAQTRQGEADEQRFNPSARDLAVLQLIALDADLSGAG